MEAAGGEHDECFGQSSGRKIGDTVLQAILKEHREWVGHGRQGPGMANFSGKDLSGADFQRADLRGAKFGDAKLHHTSLLHADLRETDLSQTKCLSSDQLGGANLARATLPPGLSFDADIADVDRKIADAGKTMLGVAALCSYAFLTMLSVSDAAIITGLASALIPGAGVAINIIGFLYVVPVLLFVLFINLMLSLQRLWESLIRLPAVFPDGSLVYDRISPWLPNAVVWRYFPQLEHRRPILWIPQLAFSVFVLWGLILPTFHALWARTLCARDATLSLVLAVILLISCTTAIGMWQHAARTLREGASRVVGFVDRSAKFWRSPTTMVVVMVWVLTYVRITCVLMYGAPEDTGPDRCCFAVGSPWRAVVFWPLGGVCDPVGRCTYRGVRTLRRVWFWPYADLAGAQLSEKGPGYSPATHEPVEPAELPEKNLSCVNATRAFLVRADLHNANLARAVLARADLTRADLRGADLRWADLRQASLQGAYLQGARLGGANLAYANLRGAVLRGTAYCPLGLEPCQEARSDAKGLTQKQLDSAVSDHDTLLPDHIPE